MESKPKLLRRYLKKKTARRRTAVSRIPRGCGNLAFMGAVVSRTHEWSVPIHMFASSAGTSGYYTFATNATQVYTISLLPALFGLNEWLTMATDYQLFRIKGCTLELRSTINSTGQPSMVSTAQLSVDLLMSLAINSAQWVPTSQTALRFTPGSQTMVKKYYSFPDIIAGNQGYPQVGRSLWYNSATVSDQVSQISMVAGLGFANYSQATAVFNYQVAELCFRFYLDWAKPVKSRAG
jgi:hypothetical protein